jgi:hypothetical protein
MLTLYKDGRNIETMSHLCLDFRKNGDKHVIFELNKSCFEISELA